MNSGPTAPARAGGGAVWAPNFGGGVVEATAPFGLQGGQPAPPHQLFIRTAAGDTKRVEAESFYDLDAGDVFEIYQSGGGGYGDPRERPVETVQLDVLNGLVSPAAAQARYGVVVDADSGEVDEAATAALRGTGH
jgi:N-methylhydantoinase B